MDELCYICGSRPAREGKTTCEVCAAKRHEQYLRRKARNISKGLCPTCGRPMDRDGFACTLCLEKKQAAARERYTARRQKHLCVCCGEQDSWTLKGRWLCGPCARRHSERIYGRKERKKATQDG